MSFFFHLKKFFILIKFQKKKSSDIVQVRIQQMEPDLMDIGTNLGDTIKYQTVHEELISKLKVEKCDNFFFPCTY
jgi:hypothetical protein